MNEHKSGNINNMDEKSVECENAEKHEDQMPMQKKDLITSAVLIVFGMYLLISGALMSQKTMALADSPWYGTPGMFPIFIGAALVILSSVMLSSLLKSDVCMDKDDVFPIGRYFRSESFRRTLVAIGFLAIYVFILFGNINFLLATVIYLFSTMLYFREKGFAVWKIAVISVAFTGFLYLFFGVLAGVPLP